MPWSLGGQLVEMLIQPAPSIVHCMTQNRVSLSLYPNSTTRGRQQNQTQVASWSPVSPQGSPTYFHVPHGHPLQRCCIPHARGCLNCDNVRFNSPMAPAPQACAWQPHRQRCTVAASSSPRIANLEGSQERVNVLVAGVVSVSLSLSLSLSFQGCAVAAAVSSSNGIVPFRWFPWEQVTLEQDEPQQGTCSTCIGVVDDTLGSCSATTNCVSSFDDRPNFFVAPWEFPGGLKVAVSNLQEALVRSGASIKEKSERYIYAVFTGEDGVSDDVEFLFSDPTLDATVNVRSASRATDHKDSGRNGKRLEALRMELGWEQVFLSTQMIVVLQQKVFFPQVPILRNRQRRLFFIESPWDTFGPEPPPTFDYKGGVEFVPD